MPHNPSIQQRLLRNVAAEAGARVFYLGTRFFIPPFVLARIGMEAYGLYGTVFILVAYFGISAIGFSNAYVKYVAEFSASRQTDRVNRLLSSGLTLTSAAGVAGMGGLVWAWPAVARWMRVPHRLDSDARVLAFVIVGVFFAYLALSVFRDTLTGLQEIAIVQKVWIGSVILETLLIFALVGAGFGLRGLGMAFACRTLFEIGGNWLWARRRAPWLRVRLVKPDRESMRVLLRFGGVVQINSMLSIVLSSVDRVVATPLLGLEIAGVLDLGKRFPSMATSIPSAFASSILPSAADVHSRTGGSEEGLAQLRALYLSSARMMNLASGTLFAFLAFAATPCMVFWLGKSAPALASELTVIFAIGLQIHMLTGPGTALLKAVGRPKLEFHYSLSNCLSLAVLVPASRLVWGRWDVTGIAVAVVTSTAVSASWFLWQANRALRIELSVFLRQVVWPGAVAYGAAAALAPLLWWLPCTNRLQAAGVLAASGTLYLAIVAAGLARWVAAPEELQAVKQQVRRLAGWTAFRRRSELAIETMT